MQVGVTCAGTADLDQHLPRSGLRYGNVAELARLLPLDEPKSLDDVALLFPVATLAPA